MFTLKHLLWLINYYTYVSKCMKSILVVVARWHLETLQADLGLEATSVLTEINALTAKFKSVDVTSDSVAIDLFNQHRYEIQIQDLHVYSGTVAQW
jgi:hypothetical protein